MNLEPVFTQSFTKINDVYVFIENGHYSDSFGLQWSRYARTQLDSHNKQNRSRKRFESETGWNEEQLRSSITLDAGCGSGRFSEIASQMGADVISIDSSSAAFAARKNLDSSCCAVLQCDLTKIPLPDNFADFVFCIGVLQHTSNPKDVLAELFRVLRPQGELVITFYEKKGFKTLLYSKYIWRPLTRKVKPETLLKIITTTAFCWFPITKFLFTLPSPIGKIIQFIVPVANYVNYKYENKQDAIDEAILDTFDMLSPKHDRPFSKSEIRAWVSELGQESIELQVLPERGTLKFSKL
jgi:ubiquinone/menaquinone biosynthesis C-methylase UbiE